MSSFPTQILIINFSSHRQRRALAGLTRQGVPIMEESYLQRKNHTSHDYYQLAAYSDNSVHSPRLKYYWGDYSRRYLLYPTMSTAASTNSIETYSSSPNRPHEQRQFHHQSHHHHQQQGHHQFTAHHAPHIHPSNALIHQQEDVLLPGVGGGDDKIVLTDRSGNPRGYAQVIRKREYYRKHTRSNSKKTTSHQQAYFQRRAMMVTIM